MRLEYMLSITVFLALFPTAIKSGTPPETKNKPKLKCPLVFHGIPKHSACIPPSKDFISGGVSEDDKKLIVNFCNKVRLQVPACFMYKFYWGDLEAVVAQGWAANCQFKNDDFLKRKIPGYYFLAQNIGRNYANWQAGLDAWNKESKIFKYGGPNDVDDIRNYSQIIFDKAIKIGCGFAKCKTFTFYVCNIGPFQKGLSKPYEKCENKHNMIDCKGKVCLNDGSMKKYTCNCSCPKHEHIFGPECDVSCAFKDKPPCNVKWHESCCTYTYVPAKCPWLCRACPYIEQYRKLLKSSASDTSRLSIIILMSISIVLTWFFQ